MNILRFCKLLFLAVILSLGMASCGSDDGGSTGSSDLTDAEKDAVADTFVDAMSGAFADYGAGSSPRLALPYALTTSVAINHQQPCQVSGHITATGNITVTASETSASIYGLVQFNISDPTNNQNDCQPVVGYYTDGSLTLTISGNSTDGVGASIAGMFDIATRGPTGGLIPVESCIVNLTIPRGGTSVTGSVCGRPVS